MFHVPVSHGAPGQGSHGQGIVVVCVQASQVLLDGGLPRPQTGMLTSEDQGAHGGRVCIQSGVDDAMPLGRVLGCGVVVVCVVHLLTHQIVPEVQSQEGGGRA